MPFEGLHKIISLLKRGYFSKEIASLEIIHELEKDYICSWAYQGLNSGKEGIVTYRLASAIRTFYLAASPLMGLLLLPAVNENQQFQ